jgi:Dockerin type I domain
MRASLAGLLALLAATMLLAPREADAMCCLCRNCTGAPFCVDGIPNSQTCANFCLSVSCPGVVFDSMDGCSGGCDGAANAPTATPPATATVTQTRTVTATATQTATATATNASTATQTATDTATPTASETATSVNTPTAVDTGTVTQTPTVTLTPTESATATQTGTVTETPTATATPALGGQILYYSEDRPVAGVVVDLLGTTPGSALTDSIGAYAFAPPLSGAVALQPSKHGDFNNAITSLDASWVLQVVASLRTFTPDQSLAADVTGDGTVSTLDASLMLQFQVGLINHFPVSEAEVCGSDWIFRPDAAAAPNQTVVPPMVANKVCQQGEISFDPFVAPVAGQDFVAILFGDVTGNWEPKP